MSVSAIRQLREQRGRVVSQAQELIPPAGQFWQTEKRILFDNMMNEAEELKRSIDRAEAEAYAGAAEYETRSTRRPPEDQIGDGMYYETDREKRYRKVFTSFLRNGLHRSEFGESGLAPDEAQIFEQEQRDMGTGGGNALQGTGGGYFVPVGFVQDVERAMKYYGPMLSVGTIMDTATGAPLPYPTSNDTSITAELCAEGSQVGSQDVTLSSVLLESFKYSSKMVKVSMELIQDSAFDMDGFLTTNFGERFGRKLNRDFTVGTGTTEPLGIITGGTASGVTMIGDDNATSPDPTKEVGYLDLVALEHSVDPVYRPGAAFMLADSTLKFIKGLKDKYGHPLWTPGFAIQAPDTVLGYKYYVNNDMAELGAGHICVAFGRLDKYLIRRVKQMAVLRLVERFADYGQLAFIGFARYDGVLLDAGTHPVKYLVNHS